MSIKGQQTRRASVRGSLFARVSWHWARWAHLNVIAKQKGAWFCFSRVFSFSLALLFVNLNVLLSVSDSIVLRLPREQTLGRTL